jgi:hypothetical protein
MRLKKNRFASLKDPVFSCERRNMWIFEKDMVERSLKGTADFSHPLKRRITPRVSRAKRFERFARRLIIEKRQK